MFVERQGLIIWLHSVRNYKILRKFGSIHFVSKRLKYAVIYCNKENVEQLVKEISGISFVKSVEISHKGDIRMEYETKKSEKESEREDLKSISI
jgi:uncharacterized protein YlbG (UPF0298 family)